MPAGGDRPAAEPAFVGQEIAMVDQPGTGTRDQLVEREDGHRLAPEIADQPALGVGADPLEPEQLGSHLLMLEQRPPAPVEGTDRGEPRRGLVELAAEMGEHGLRQDLDRVQQPPRHLQEADVEGQREPVQRRLPLPHAGQLGPRET